MTVHGIVSLNVDSSCKKNCQIQNFTPLTPVAHPLHNAHLNHYFPMDIFDYSGHIVQFLCMRRGWVNMQCSWSVNDTSWQCLWNWFSLFPDNKLQFSPGRCERSYRKRRDDYFLPTYSASKTYWFGSIFLCAEVRKKLILFKFLYSRTVLLLHLLLHRENPIPCFALFRAVLGAEMQKWNFYVRT